MATSESSTIAGHLLCLLPFPEPTAIIERIKKQHSQLRVTYHHLSLKVDWKSDECLSEGMKNLTIDQMIYKAQSLSDIWKDVTILYTLSQFPANLALAPNLSECLCITRSRV